MHPRIYLEGVTHRVADLTFIEKSKLEKLFGMGSGYVLDFSNRTFTKFVADSVGKDIVDDKYAYGTGSKANRLRAFWSEEPNYVVGKLIADLIEYCRPNSSAAEVTQLEECRQIAKRLRQGAPIPDMEALTPNSDGRDFDVLAKSVREAISNNEPEAGLDRLHTFVVKYVRVLCQKRGISVEREKPLHSLFGEYVKRLKEDGMIESEMTERILKSSISVMEAFNRVRNEQSLAHDNPVLNYNESLLIFNHVASAIKFIAAVEAGAEEAARGDVALSKVTDDIPF